VIFLGEGINEGSMAMPRVKLAPGIEYKIRISEALRNRIERAAKRNKNSANVEMSRRLEASFEEPAGIKLETVLALVSTAQKIYDQVSKLLEQRARKNAAYAQLLTVLREMPEQVLAADPQFAEDLDRALNGLLATEAALEPA
jgi:hypothetical protein